VNDLFCFALELLSNNSFHLFKPFRFLATVLSQYIVQKSNEITHKILGLFLAIVILE